MAVLKNVSIGTMLSGIETDVYINTTGTASLILSAAVTCIDSVGDTVGMGVCTSSNVISEWIIPPATSVGYNNGLVETRKIVVPNGYRVRATYSTTMSSYSKGAISVNVAEGVSTS